MVVDNNGKLFSNETIRTWLALGLAIFTVVAWGLRLEFKSDDHESKIADLKSRLDIIDTTGTRALASVVLQTAQVSSRFDKIEAHLEKLDVLSSQVQRIEDRQGKVIDTLAKSTDVLNRIVDTLHGRTDGGPPGRPQ